MSANTDLHALLTAATALVALVGDRIAADRMEQTEARPFVVYTSTATERSTTLTGDVLGVKTTFEVQAWADTRIQADAVGDEIQNALEADHQFVVNRSSGYDSALDLEATIITVDWWA